MSVVLNQERRMRAKARLLGHPIHQMLIVFPLGLLATAMVFDLIRFATGNPRWSEVAFWMIGAGIVGGLLAAPFGLIDWLAVPRDTRARRVGALHGLGNVVVLGLFAGSWLIRRDAPLAPEGLAYLLSFGGAVVSVATAWLGGELVNRLGVGVDEGAHVNAPSSLSTDHAGTISGRAIP
jgi:uncharacterized membrane protein